MEQLLDNLTEEVSCSVCGDIYKEPKQLPCLHSFCLGCLNKLARTRAVNGNIQCPLCQRQVAVPESGTFETFPSSFYINSLLDVLAIKQCGTSHVACGNCAIKSQECSYCFHCGHFWCGGCLNAHNILRANKEHRVAALNDFEAKDFEDVLKRPAICKIEHHEEILKYYCKECDVAACQVCVILKHGGHDIEHLEVISKQGKAKIIAKVENAKRKAQKYAEKIQKTEKDVYNVQELVEVVKREIDDQAERLIRVIRKQQRQLSTEAENAMKTSQDQLMAGKETVLNQVKKIELAIDQAENHVQRGVSAEIVQSRQQVEEQLEEAVTEDPETEPFECSRLAFADNVFLFNTLTTSGIGRLGRTCTDHVQSTAEGGKGLTEAVTGLKAEFVVTTKNSKGDVCYSPVDRVAVKLKCQGSENPLENIQIQDNKDGTYQVSYFAADPGYHDMHVTVNKEDVCGTPFPPIQVKPREFKSVLSLGSEGEEPGEFRNPWGVAVNEHGEIAVTDCTNARVQVFNSDGLFLLSFGMQGSDHGQFDQPRGITYDRHGNLLVADRNNNRIQQFSRKGQFIGTFGTTGELEGKLVHPLGISLCPSGNVIVATKASGCIVFSPEGHLLLELNDAGLSPIHCIYHGNRFIMNDNNEHCIKVFGEQGDFLYRFGKSGAGDGEFNDIIAGLAIDKSGRLVVCDSDNHRIQLFELDGTFCCKFGVKGTGPGNFDRPASIAIMNDGKFVVTEFKGHRVQIMQ